MTAKCQCGTTVTWSAWAVVKSGVVGRIYRCPCGIFVTQECPMELTQEADRQSDERSASHMRGAQ